MIQYSAKVMRNILLGIVAGGLVIAAVIAIAVFVHAPQSSPQENAFKNVYSVSPSSTLKMQFPQPMDQKSVEANLQMPKKLQGDLTWEDGALVFSPREALKMGDSYTFIVNADAQAANGEKIGQSLTFIFSVTGAPIISAHIPSENASVSPKTKVTIIFDRAMVPLTQVQGEQSRKKWASWAATITPPVQGSWRWLGTSAVEFTPQASFAAATRYTVTVPRGIPSVSGEKTEQEYSWSFTTESPTIVSMIPVKGTPLAPSEPITLTFNQEIDLKSAQAAISLNQSSGKELADVRAFDQYAQAGNELPVIQSDTVPDGTLAPVSVNIRYGTTLKNGKRILDKSVILIDPKAPLPFNRTFVITVEKSLRGTEGSLEPRERYQLVRSTPGELKVTDMKNEYGQLAITFSNEMNTESIKKYISLTPTPKNWDNVDITVNNYDAMGRLYLSPTLAPSTHYKIVIKKDIQDIHGQHLKSDYVGSVMTPALNPEIYIDSKGKFGFFERDKPPVYNINAVNVKTMTVKLAKLSLNEFITQQVAERNYNSNLDLSAMAEYQEWKISPKKKLLNQWEVIPFDILQKRGKALAPSIYAFTVESPEYKSSYDGKPVINKQYFALTDIALTLKYSGNRTMLWAVDMKTGKPVSNAEISYYTITKEKVISGYTDANGIFESEIDSSKLQLSDPSHYYGESEFWVTAEKDGDFSFVSSNWRDGIRGYDFEGVSEKYELGREPMFELYTERPLYRSGDTVSFKGIMRMLDVNGHFSIPANQRINVSISDADHLIYSENLALSEFGSFHGSFPLEKQAKLGTYTIIASLEGNDRFSKYAIFHVLAYRKPEYRVDVTPEREHYTTGETIKADVSGSYYFGAPMSNADVTWNVVSTDYFFNKYTEGWYSFALESYWCWWYCTSESKVVTEGKGKLDAAGKLSIAIPANITAEAVGQVFTIEVTVTDKNNQTVSQQSSVFVHKSKTYVGIARENFIVQPGEKTKMKLITVDVDGNPKPKQSVHLKLFSVKWNTVRKKGVDGEFYYDNEKIETFLKDSIVQTDEKGKAVGEFDIVNGGEYRVTATVKDETGKSATSGESLYSWSNTYVNWPRVNNDRIAVLADKREYALGDTAKLLVKSPFQGPGVRALITVERENIITKSIVDVTSSAMKFEVPITEEMLPNAFVSVTIIKPRIGETFDDSGLDTGRPGFKMGYVRLDVETKKKELNIDITTDKEKYAPGEKVTVRLSTKDWKGKPIPAELSLGVVDMSLLALSGFKKPDLIASFYSKRGLSVRTSNLLMYLIDRYKPGSKGGGGGPEERTRSNMADTAYWNPQILTNERGEAQISFTLPDNLTTWQLLAIGSTKDHSFGAEVKTIVESKKVVVRPVRPRFAVVGDSLTLGAIVHNFTEESKVFSVTLQGKGFTSMGSNSHRVEIAPGKQAKVSFPVKVIPGKALTLNFSANADGVIDAIEEVIPVYPFGTLQSVATNGITSDVSQEKVLIPSTSDASYGTLELSVSPTIASFIPKGLEYVSRYPYGCTEQVMSSLLPNIALQSMQNLKSFQYVNEKELKEKVIASLQKLYRNQGADGGFKYWDTGDTSYPYLTAYVLFGLQKTKESGFVVDSGVASRAKQYLEMILRQDVKGNRVNAATRAYILYVLSEGAKPNESLLMNAYENREVLPAFSKAHVAMAFWSEGSSMSKKKAKELLKEIIDTSARVDARGTSFEEAGSSQFNELMQSNMTTTAIVLQALVRIEPTHPLIPKIIRYLLDARNEGHWDTTQSTSLSILSLIEYLKMTKELEADMQSTVSVLGKAVISKRFTSKNLLERETVSLSIDSLLRGKETDISLQKKGKGSLYYDVLLSYFYTPEIIEPVDNGITILREMSPLVGSPTAPTVGGTYKVTLTMTVPKERHFVAVESPFPAGMEGIDFALKTSSQAMKNTVNSEAEKQRLYWWSDDYLSNALWRFNHIEFRDDSVFLFADSLPAGVYQYEYLVRATLPGTFRVRPSKMWEMYTPETFGQTEGKWLTIADTK